MSMLARSAVEFRFTAAHECVSFDWRTFMSDRDRNSQIVGSVLFTDLVGFTEFNDIVGDGVAFELLEQQTMMAKRALGDRATGRLVKELGDGLMMWFDSAHAGLATASALMTTIEAARTSGDFPLAIRMGIHHGEVMTRGDDVLGQTVNIAARVSALAGPGELLVSDNVIQAKDVAQGRNLADGPSEFVPLGPVVVKGVREPIWLHRLVR